LNLIPLKRQFTIKGDYCDILAKSNNNQLVVLELKNCEDRYVIHQLTRYYHSLTLEQPFKDLIDYSLPIRLIAIAPDFHRHNFVDRHYNKLEFEFIRFSVIEELDKFHLKLHLADRKEMIVTNPISFKKPHLSKIQDDKEIQINAPPRILVNFLDKLSMIKKREILRFREKILLSDRRIKEIKISNGILYGRGKTKPCCHLKFVQIIKSDPHYFLVCFLWLPVPQKFLHPNRTSGICRMRLLCDPDFSEVMTVTWYTEDGRHSKESSIPIEEYLDAIGLKLTAQIVDQLFELAIQLNLERK
jgi:hypothetical protein